MPHKRTVGKQALLAILALPTSVIVFPQEPIDDETIIDVWPHVKSLPTAELGPDLQPIEPEEPIVWGRALPFLAQKVVDMGYELPQPYGLGAVYAGIEQDLVLSGLEVRIGDQDIDAGFVTFEDSNAHNKTIQFKADTWLLPFMNVYLVGGEVDGKANISLSMPAEEVIKLIAPGLCEGVIKPPVCDETLRLNPQPHYVGDTLGLGTILAGGWNQYFVTLAVTWVKTDLNIVESEIETLNASPRVGITLPLKSREQIVALFVGANYLDADMDLTGSIDIDLPDVGRETIEFKINQKNKDEWNYLVGANYDFGKKWNMNAEIGFGGSRENIIAGITYRW